MMPNERQQFGGRFAGQVSGRSQSTGQVSGRSQSSGIATQGGGDWRSGVRPSAKESGYQNASLQGLKKGENHAVMERVQIQDMIAASEARTDTKFAKMEGKLDVLLEKMTALSSGMVDIKTSNAATKTAVDASADRAEAEGRQTRRTYRTTAISTAIAVTALVIAMFGLFINSFNLGASGKSLPAPIGAAPGNSTLMLENRTG